MDYTAIYAGDIEADNLYDDVTKMWCVVHQNIVTEELYVYHDYPEFDNTVIIDPYDKKEYTIPVRNGSLVEGLREWYKISKEGGRLAVHNALSYDKYVIEKFYPKCVIPKSTWIDTYVQSKNQWHSRPTPKGAKSPHGLAAYGIRFGVHKPEYKNWKVLTEEEWSILEYYEKL